MTDFRQALAAVTKDAKALHKREREMTIESVLLVGTLDVARAHIQVRMTRDAFAEYIELTPAVYGKRAQAARVMRRFPTVRGMLERGETSISHLAAVAGKMTNANAHLIIPALAEKSKHQLEAYLSRVTRQGDLLPEEGQVEVKVRLTQSELALLTRAREVLAANGHVPNNAEIFKTALGDLLAKRDKLARAEPARAKDELRARAAEVDASGHRPPQLEAEFPQVDNMTVRAAEVDAPAHRALQVESELPRVDSFAAPSAEVGAPGHRAPRVEAEFSQVDNMNVRAAEVDAPGHRAIEVMPSRFRMSSSQLFGPTQDQDTPRYYANRPRKSISARTRHAVWLRDEGRCSEALGDGSRCPERSIIEIDHVQPWCRGGSNTLENLALRCRNHDRHRVEVLLGARYVDRWAK